jgi:hypothetical protein
MDRVIAALKRAGIADRDIQTRPRSTSIPNIAIRRTSRRSWSAIARRTRSRSASAISEQRPYPRRTGRRGGQPDQRPEHDDRQPQAALDEARAHAVAAGRARAELYARALGKRVARVISISESGGHFPRRQCRWPNGGWHGELPTPRSSRASRSFRSTCRWCSSFNDEKGRADSIPRGLPCMACFAPSGPCLCG